MVAGLVLFVDRVSLAYVAYLMVAVGTFLMSGCGPGFY